MNERNVLRLLLLVMVLLGLVFRALPLLDDDNRLYKQWPTEDGYLMLTIARNIAIGNGMSIGEGTIKTNGTQPLVTLIFAGAFKTFGGSKEAGIYFVHIWEILISLATCYVLFGFSRDVLGRSKHANRIACITAGMWFISPVFVRHSMNHLETGTYFLLVLATIWVWYARLGDDQKSEDFKSSILIGGLLGITALIRIDAVFLIAAVTVWNVLPYIFQRREQLRNRFIQSLMMGSIAVFVTSPWLLYNKINFGAFTPISGVSLAMDRPERGIPILQENLTRIPMLLMEFIGVIFPIPNSVERMSIVQWLCPVFVLVWLVAHLFLAAKANFRQRVTMAIVGTVLACFVVYYGFVFGAPHFLERYLASASLLFGITTSLCVLCFLDRIQVPNSWSAIILIGLIAMCAWGQIRIYRNGLNHFHWHVIDWTNENVAEDSWIGAIQSGMLGFFHDKTINLDGKVNPQAVLARQQNRISQYIKDSQIEYLIDWHGITTLHAGIQDQFDILVNDPNIGYNGLGVLRRKSLCPDSKTK